MNEYKIIKIKDYKRKDHFNYFRSLPYPYVGVTCDVDVSELKEFTHRNNYSFYLTFMHVVALAADEINELRQRIHGDDIIEYNECPTSHTELLEDGTYCYCTLYHHMPFREYIEYALKEREKCKRNGSIDEEENVDQMYFITSLPWLNYTSLIQPVAGNDESNPRISWGKYKEVNSRLMMPVSILVHHSLVDGVQIAKFYELLNTKMHDIINEK